MPFIEDEKIAWLKIVNPDRINQRIIGSLGGRSLQKAKRLANAAAVTAATIGNNIDDDDDEDNTTKELGSLYVYTEDFVKLI